MHKVKKYIYSISIVMIIFIAIIFSVWLWSNKQPYDYDQLKDYFKKFGYTVQEPENLELKSVEEGFTVCVSEDTRLEYFVFKDKTEVMGFYLTLADGILQMYPNADVEINNNEIGFVHEDFYMCVILNDTNIFCVYTKEGDVEAVNLLLSLIPIKNISSSKTYISVNDN